LPYLLIAPAALVLVAILGYPLGYSFQLSFREWTMRTFRFGVPFVGLANYLEILGDENFWHAMQVTFIYMVGAISLEFILGMGLALLLNRELKVKGLIRSLILLPMMCTNVVIGLVWRLMLNYEYGIINYFLSLLNIPPVQWLSSLTLALPSFILVDVWNTTSFVALILLAGLQSLPEEPFEAAIIDGASRWQLFRYVTLPLMRSPILVALLWRVIDTFRVFDVPFVLTGGGPYRATEVVSIFTYRAGFQSFNLGYASASSFVMIIVMLVMAVVLMRLIGRAEIF
jgi:multiple sugar transport system permease protein